MKGEIFEGAVLAAGTVVAIALFGEDIFICVYDLLS